MGWKEGIINCIIEAPCIYYTKGINHCLKTGENFSKPYVITMTNEFLTGNYNIEISYHSLSVLYRNNKEYSSKLSMRDALNKAFEANRNNKECIKAIKSFLYSILEETIYSDHTRSYIDIIKFDNQEINKISNIIGTQVYIINWKCEGIYYDLYVNKDNNDIVSYFVDNKHIYTGKPKQVISKYIKPNSNEMINAFLQSFYHEYYHRTRDTWTL